MSILYHMVSIMSLDQIRLPVNSKCAGCCQGVVFTLSPGKLTQKRRLYGGLSGPYRATFLSYPPPPLLPPYPPPHTSENCPLENWVYNGIPSNTYMQTNTRTLEHTHAHEHKDIDIQLLACLTLAAKERTSKNL